MVNLDVSVIECEHVHIYASRTYFEELRMLHFGMFLSVADPGFSRGGVQPTI